MRSKLQALEASCLSDCSAVGAHAGPRLPGSREHLGLSWTRCCVGASPVPRLRGVLAFFLNPLLKASLSHLHISKRKEE